MQLHELVPPPEPPAAVAESTERPVPETPAALLVTPPLFVVPPVGAAVLGLCSCMAALLILVRCFIVVLFFSRYSLRDMMAWTLSVGAFMTVIVAAPGGWKVVGGIGFGSVVGWSIIYLLQQDPEGEAATPPFIAQALRARKLRAIREAREKRKGQELPRAGPPNTQAGRHRDSTGAC